MRIYLHAEESSVARFLWFHNPKPNEMLMGISGLASPTSVLDSEYPVREISGQELLAVRYEYKDENQILKSADHITCHPDGTFHIKTRDKKDLYVHRMRRVEPLGPNTPIFLEFIILSDQTRNYTSIDKDPKKPNVTLRLPPDNLVALRGLFSGSRFNLEKIFRDTIFHVTGDQIFPGIHVRGETLHGYIHGHQLSLPEDVLRSRPPGTLVSFKFPVANDRYHLKSFRFV